MTGSFWWDLFLGVAGAVVFAWLALVVVLVLARPRGGLLREALRLLPDVLRLVRRLTADKTLPRGVRIRLGLLVAYLAMPIDLIPDFIPVLGYADDAIIVTAVLRGVVRRAGIEAVRAHWPGSDDGFAAVARLTGLNGGLAGGATDAARLALLHLGDGSVDGTRLLSPQAAAEMRRTVARGGPIDVGLGWFRPSGQQATFVQHLGGGSGFFSVMRIYPDQDVGVVMMANTTRYDYDAILDAIVRSPS